MHFLLKRITHFYFPTKEKFCGIKHEDNVRPWKSIGYAINDALSVLDKEPLSYEDIHQSKRFITMIGH